ALSTTAKSSRRTHRGRLYGDGEHHIRHHRQSTAVLTEAVGCIYPRRWAGTPHSGWGHPRLDATPVGLAPPSLALTLWQATVRRLDRRLWWTYARCPCCWPCFMPSSAC